jgi:hypothetical protein
LMTLLAFVHQPGILRNLGTQNNAFTILCTLLSICSIKRLWPRDLAPG